MIVKPGKSEIYRVDQCMETLAGFLCYSLRLNSFFFQETSVIALKAFG